MHIKQHIEYSLPKLSWLFRYEAWRGHQRIARVEKWLERRHLRTAPEDWPGWPALLKELGDKALAETTPT